MTDLPIASPPSAPATSTWPTANAGTRAAPARNATLQPNASPFQDALALELGLGTEGAFPPGVGVPAAAAKAGGGLKPGEDTAQAAIAADAPFGLALVGMPPLPSTLASRSLPAVAASASLSPAFAPMETGPAGLAPDPRKEPLAATAAAPTFEPDSPIAASAAAFTLPGKYSPSAQGEIRREITLDTKLLDQHKAPPEPSAAIYAGGAAPAEVAHAPVAALEARVGERGRDQGLGDKLAWMAGQRQQVAQLQPNPADLGAPKIAPTLDHDRLVAQSVFARVTAREAIAPAMPRLREILADSGILRGNTGVSSPALRGQFSPSGAGEIAQTSAAQQLEPQLPIDSAAADIIPLGQFHQSAEDEIGHKIVFDTGLPHRHIATPAPAPAIYSSGAAMAQAAPVAALEARLGERGWDQGLGDKLVWMAGHGQQVAELHLNPPDLGPLKITLTLDQDQASAQFITAHASVSDAIETAMPRLREMLADSGITLGNASVSTDAFREQAQPQHQPRAYPAAPAAAAADPGVVIRENRLLRRSHGLVDTFA
ncbi:MAG: flagellar hook-length control protein FliK [Betaproteobacteria bacterium]|nr:flagellar hook-length control protein FliK [Betaproteobacteria bacterium]